MNTVYRSRFPSSPGFTASSMGKDERRRCVGKRLTAIVRKTFMSIDAEVPAKFCGGCFFDYRKAINRCTSVRSSRIVLLTD